MSCYHPLQGARLPNGTVKIFAQLSTALKNYQGEILKIPCGRCVGCRLDYASDWADRMCIESKLRDHSWFVTLTYDDEHVPYTDDLCQTLKPKDMTDFLKRYRRAIEPEKISYYYSGEYGTQTLRPHYHMILFGSSIYDLELYQKSPNGVYYKSKWFDSIWQKGNCIITEFSWQTASYTARYVLKKLGMPKEHWDHVSIYPEFSRCSRRPAIGRRYFDQFYEEIYKNDEIFLSGGKVVKPPKYFDNLLKGMDLDLLEHVKEIRRKSGEISFDTELSKTNLDEYDYLCLKEDVKLSKAKHLGNFSNL